MKDLVKVGYNVKRNIQTYSEQMGSDMMKIAMLFLLYATTLLAHNIEDSLRSAAHVDSSVVQLIRFERYLDCPQYGLNIFENGVTEFHLFNKGDTLLSESFAFSPDSVLSLMDDLVKSGLFEMMTKDGIVPVDGDNSLIIVNWQGKSDELRYNCFENLDCELYGQKVDLFARTDSRFREFKECVRTQLDRFKGRDAQNR